MIIGDVGLFGAMPISPIKPSTDMLIGDNGDGSEKDFFTGGFADAIRDSWQAAEQLSAASKETTAQLLTGELDDLTEHLVNGEKSSIMFEYNLQVRNKLLDAYQEIMKTQI